MPTVLRWRRVSYISICALVIALYALPPLVSRDAQGNPILGAELLQLRHDARGDYGRGLRIQQIHEGLLQFEFSADGVRQEIGIDQNAVAGPESVEKKK